MLILTVRSTITLVLCLALINSYIFIAFSPGMALRLVISAMMNLSGVVLVVFYFKSKFWKSEIHTYYKVMITLLIVWSVGVFVRALSVNAQDMISLFGHYLMGWAWLTPFAIVIGFKQESWSLIYKLVYVSLIVGFLLTLTTIINVRLATGILEWVVIFPVLFLTLSYHNGKMKAVAVLSVPLFLYLSYLASQRANLIYALLSLTFFAFESVRGQHVSVFKRVAVFLTTLGLLVVLVAGLNSIFNNQAVFDAFITDTRTFLFLELVNDFNAIDLFVGRGALGTYYSPYFDALIDAGIDGGDFMTRQVNEVGYLQMILKGGLVLMVLQLGILIPAAITGIFKGNNITVRMCGYLILSYVFLWFVSYYPVYSAEYLLLWISVGTVISQNTMQNSGGLGRV